MIFFFLRSVSKARMTRILILVALASVIGVLLLVAALLWRALRFTIPYPIRQELSAEEIVYPIDAVFTWVDSSDEQWAQTKSNLLLEAGVEDEPQRWSNDTTPEAELELSIELLLQNAPWIRHIFIVTMRPQRPRCLDTNSAIRERRSKISVVHHDEIWEEASHLPSFNSHAIEAHLHRIPGLSEHFLYLNDDVFVTQPMLPNNWFYDGKPIFYPNGGKHSRLFYGIYLNSHGMAWRNLHGMLNHKPVHLKHFVHPLTKTVLSDIERGGPWSMALKHTKKSRFRSEDDIPPIGLALNVGLQNNTVVLVDPKLIHTQYIGSDVAHHLKTDPLPQIVCVNNSKNNIDDEVHNLRSVLQKDHQRSWTIVDNRG